MSSQHADRSSARKELQGTRPAPLKISRESHKIRKPPLPAVPAMQYRQPVIIYTHSPKVIHTEAGDFMTLVQRLTGRSCKKDNGMIAIRDAHRSDGPTHSSATEPSGLDIAVESSGHELPSENGNREIGTADGGVGRASSLQPKEESVDGGSIPGEPSAGRSVQYAAGATGGSLPSPVPSAFPPWSPNFFVPSPRLLSPNIFQDFPLFTPNSDFFCSPRHLMYRPSDSMFTPTQRPSVMNSLSSVPSPSPTGFDLFNNILPEY